MSRLRFSARHAHKTLADHIEAELASLGWVNAPVNFKTTAVTFLEFQPEEAGTEIKPNTVVITLGDEPADIPQELGAADGGVWQNDYLVYVDIYGANASIALSLASDVKSVLSDLSLFVRDFTATAEGELTTEHLFIDREDVFVERPPASVGSPDLRRFWRVVHATAQIRFQD